MRTIMMRITMITCHRNPQVMCKLFTQNLGNDKRKQYMRIRDKDIVTHLVIH